MAEGCDGRDADRAREGDRALGLRPGRCASGRDRQALRRCRGGRRHRPRDRPRRVLHAARPVRLRQDDLPADDRGLRAPRRGPHHARRPRRVGHAAGRARREHGLSGLRAVPAHDRGRQRRLRPEGQEVARASASSASPRRWRWCASTDTATAARASSAAASASASRLRARSSTARACCCSTSRSERSTSSSASSFRSSSSASSQEVGITFVYVTHDQDEALTMSDRIAVVDGGQMLQVGSPRDVYERPDSRSSPASSARATCSSCRSRGSPATHSPAARPR